MKKPPSRSGYINLRVLLACTLCLASLFLAATAFGAWPALFARAWISAQNEPAREGKAKIRKSISPAGAIAMKSNPGSGANSRSAAQIQTAGGDQTTIATQTNAAGQTVYSISPSNFDISPPLTELAAIKLPAKPKKVEREEPKLPPSRVLRLRSAGPGDAGCAFRQRFGCRRCDSAGHHDRV